MRRMYSENQIVKILENREVKVKTIEQSEPNWAYEITEFPSVEGCTSSITYCRIHQINGELHIIMQGKVHNDTENNKEVYGLTSIYVKLPKLIAEKIFDVLGNNVTATPATEVRITSANCHVFRNNETGMDLSDLADRSIMSIMNSTREDEICINFGSTTGINLQAGKDTYFEGRLFLDLI